MSSGNMGIKPEIVVLRKTEQIRQKFIKWSLELGVHGYPNIFRAQSWLLKVMWTLSLLAAVGACCYLIQLSISEYLEYNVNTRIRTLIEMPMQLPGVKICHNVIRSQDGIDYALNYYRSKTGLEHIENLAEAYSKYSTSNFEYSSLLSTISRNLSDSRLKTNLSNYMINCNLGTKSCTEYPYSYYYQDLLGNCLVLNKGNRSSDNSIVPSSIYYVNRAGSGDALSAFFYLGNWRKMSKNTLTAAYGIGLSVMIFNQTDTFINFNDEIFASPGYCTAIRLKKAVKFSIPEPYSRCQDLDSFSSDLYDRMKANNVSYKQDICIEICLHEVIIKNCSCRFESLPNIKANEKVCSTISEIQCGNKAFENNIDSLSTQCLSQCPLECERVEYSYELSFSAFPTPSMGYYNMRRELMSRYPNLTDEDLSYENIRSSTVCLSISLKSLEYTVTDESPSKTTVQLISDVGGNLGLLLGWSLLNLIDMVEIIIEIFFIIFSIK